MAAACVFCVIFIGIFSRAVSISIDLTLEDVIQQMKTMEGRLSESEREIDALRDVAVVQKDVIEKQGMEIRKLQKQVAYQDAIIRSNREKMSDCSREIESVRSSHQQSDIVHRQRNVSEETGMNKVLVPDGRHQSVIQDHTVNIPKPLRSIGLGGRIAFTSYLDHDGHYGADQAIIFNGVITNEGNGYNKYTGIFTCPLDGMYLFSFFVWGRSDSEAITQIRADLTVNGKAIVSALAETRHMSEDAQGGNSAVVRLNQGDAVWIKTHYAGDDIAGNSIHFNTFTGLHLYI